MCLIISYLRRDKLATIPQRGRRARGGDKLSKTEEYFHIHFRFQYKTTPDRKQFSLITNPFLDIVK